eukprot:2568268-Amphidinium_carterae.4
MVPGVVTVKPKGTLVPFGKPGGGFVTGSFHSRLSFSLFSLGSSTGHGLNGDLSKFGGGPFGTGLAMPEGSFGNGQLRCSKPAGGPLTAGGFDASCFCTVCITSLAFMAALTIDSSQP